ncbi:DUF1995 family protein [Plectonema cf. radiosum LEGE 06105]|uniref:DUF1995 family protein n=1 Tax=Plectonema cf. radiosum LEGE 06105 TaxID=945769 RepID=A0A8J7F8V4_9CYAN|nr:DUF1995 family protein [Plectonema radiosum]MBE9214299.1 DUF1995 family protein [Plectonema cf. radiosum LEGE 06105]
MQLPRTLEEAIVQAREATQAALADGYTRLQVELLFPELKALPVAEQFLPAFAEYGDKLKILFADAGSAALARRDWNDVPFQLLDIGTGRMASLQSKVQPEDEIFLFVQPTSVEVPQLEKICEYIGENRPFVIFAPRLEDASIVGIGYTARQTRQRFINTIESCYYLRPIFEEAAVFRCYPGLWSVWVEKDGDYQKVAELPKKPSGDELDAIISDGQPQGEGEFVAAKSQNIFKGLQRFVRALRT